MKINEILKMERENQKISRKNIAEKLCIAEGTYRDIETGRIRMSLDNFLLICQELKLSPMDLLIQNENNHYILIDKEDITALNRIVTKINNQISKTNKQDATIITGDIKGTNITIAKDYNKKINTGHIDGDNIRIGINTTKK